MIIVYPFGFSLQLPPGPLTTISGDVLTVHLSRIFGDYHPALMSRMKNLEMLVISYTHVDPRPFIDDVIDHIALNEIHMVGCTQFTEHQMIELFCCLPNLKVIDASKNRGFQYANAYIVCCSLRKLQVFKIEAKFPFYERHDWSKLQAVFPHIQFGKTINDIVSSVKK